MLHVKHFSLPEAKETLLLIKDKLERMVGLKKNLNERGYDIYLHQYFGGRGPNGTGKFPDDMEELVKIIKYISEKGILIKNIDTGLIDFPHLRGNGEEVYLCYMAGEPGILFWHRINDGFAGREPVETL